MPVIRCNRCGADNDDPIIAGLIKQNEDLMKLVTEFLLKGGVRFDFRIDEAAMCSKLTDYKQWLAEHVAKSAVHHLEQLLTSRRALYQEMDRLKFGLSRYVDHGQGPAR